MSRSKNDYGITLIALVITIIILLILAGVSLNLIAKEDGLLGKATTAVEMTQKAQAKEEIELAIVEIRAEAQKTITLETLAAGTLQAKLGEITVHFENNQITGQYKGNNYKIEENLHVVIQEEGIKWDTNPPKNVTIQQEEIIGNSVLLTLQAMDEESGISKFVIYVDDTKYAETKENMIEIRDLSSGTQHVIYVKAVDMAGNESEKSADIIIQTEKVYRMDPIVFEKCSYANEHEITTDIDTMSILFDGDLSRGRGILIDTYYWNNYMIFSTDKKVKVQAYSDTYSDSGGKSDYEILQISKYDQKTKQYETIKEVQTDVREWYELATLEPGRYKIESKKDGQRRYIRFDEWRIEEEE